ncbi:response regulator transcription factor [Aquisphaera insulae]|uniref:response regulator transcription factor n=1 Tax=Aquisphaera insulae TaxID=2712864 RepID=UPI0013EBBEB9|nr:response regulator transcription factor [Aquisphaera insulae]
MENSPPPRILLVEDEARLRTLVAQFLRGEHFDVTEAPDGPEGARSFEERGPFDLVLLDLNLPGLPGVEVCRRIRRLEPSQPVIICSAAILDSHAEVLAALGVHQFLTKPYHPEELLRRIRIELEQARRAVGEEGHVNTGSICTPRPHLDTLKGRATHGPRAASRVLSKREAID